MISATASGVILPLYIVYKAKHLYPTWIEGGIPGAGYNRNSSGWFNLEMFQDWVEKILIPYVRKLEGRKAMIGDNLSSHLSLNVIRLCEENDISFILLPPNATHLCQPLDVAFFQPLKIAWRKCLEDWKVKNKGVLPKCEFPSMLKKAFSEVSVQRSSNIISGFKACRIVPVNREMVLKKFPSIDQDPTDMQNGIERRWSNTFVEHLRQTRAGETRTSERSQARGKRLNIVAGKWIVVNDLLDSDEELVETAALEDYDDPAAVDEEESDSDRNPNTDGVINKQSEIGGEFSVFNVVDFVLVVFPTEKRDGNFIGKIIKAVQNGYEISYLRKRGVRQIFFSFPDVPDIQETPVAQIIMKLRSKSRKRVHYIFLHIDVSSID